MDAGHVSQSRQRLQRVLVLTPFGEEAGLICHQLQLAGFEIHKCNDAKQLCIEIAGGAATALVAEEMLSKDALLEMHATLSHQPTWSDFPLVVLLMQGNRGSEGEHILRCIGESSQLMLLERPVRDVTLLSGIKSAIQSRNRQYQIRDELSARRASEAALRRSEESLERQVAERTSALSLLRDIASMANDASDVESAIVNALGRVSRHNGWNCGHAWLPAENDPATLLPGYAWYEEAPNRFDDLRTCIQSIRLRSGVDLVGSVFATGEPQFTNDIAQHLASYKASIAERSGVRTACAFPILAEQKIVGVLEFFSVVRLAPSQQLLESMASVGVLLGRVVEREQAKASLRNSELQLRSILNAAPDAVVAIDRRGTITRVNPATKKMFGFTAEELLGANISKLMPTPVSENHDNYIRRYLEERVPHIIGNSREVWAQHRDGHTLPIELAVNEIEHLEMFVGIIRDISGRKELEKQVVEAAARQQQEIGQDIHDGVGQELAGLRYMAQTHAEALAEQASPEAKTARRMTEWLATVQRQLRDITRQLVPVELDALGLLVALQTLSRQTTERSGIACRVDCDQEISVSDAGLATHLYRIAQEAVRNAARHAEANEITIRLREGLGRLELSILDDGIGLVSRSENHTGIGLRSMEYRAGLIGAALRVESRKGGGTQIACCVSTESHNSNSSAPSN